MYQHPKRKLSVTQVLQIRERLKTETAYKVAKDYDVNWQVIKRIERNEIYKDIQLAD